MNRAAVIDLPSHTRVTLVFGLGLCVLFALWLAMNRDSLLTDPDTAWHITVGRDIWNSWSFPTVDSYSYTFKGQPWIAKEWLGQMILAAGFGIAGWNGVTALSALAIIALGAIVYATAAQQLKPPFAVVLTIIAMGAARSSFLARPHVFALPLTVVWSYLLFRDADDARPPRFWLLGLLVLWANLHASFTLGWAIAGLALLHYCEITRLRDRQGLARWITFVALCPLVSLIHPYGLKAALMTFAVTAANEATPLLEEWQPFNSGTQLAALAALLIWLAVGIAAGLRLSLAKTALCLGLLYLFLAHARFGSIFFTVVPVVVARELAAEVPLISSARWRTQQLDSSEFAIASRFKAIFIGGLALLATVTALMFTLLPSTRQPALAISGAMQFAKANHLNGPVMNFYNFGGALIQNGIPTYIDGRSDQLFQNGFFRNDQATMRPDGVRAFTETLAYHHIAWTVFPPRDPRNAMLGNMGNWRSVFADDTAVIHVKVD